MFKTPTTAGIPSNRGALGALGGTSGTATEQYELATHAVKIRRTGLLTDVKALWDLTGM